MVELLISLNWWAVVVAAVAYFVLGAIWYSFLFANLWMKLRELKEEDIKDPNPVIFLWSFVLQFIATLLLALFIEEFGIDRALYGAVIGFGTAKVKPSVPVVSGRG